MVHAFGIEQKARVERFYDDFFTAKDKLKSKLPQTFGSLTPEIRSQVQAAVMGFLVAVKDQNAEFIKFCVRAFSKKIYADE
jgi:hypothetical protein